MNYLKNNSDGSVTLYSPMHYPLATFRDDRILNAALDWCRRYGWDVKDQAGAIIAGDALARA